MCPNDKASVSIPARYPNTPQVVYSSLLSDEPTSRVLLTNLTNTTMKKTNSKSKSFDWKALIRLIGILIKFLFKVQKEYKQKQVKDEPV